MASEPAPAPPLPDLSRLRWQCRRGMLELDYLLRDFLEQQYPALSEPQQRDFVRLLACPDPFLYDWLLGRTAPPDAALAALVARLRAR
jgi:antitoxin CptB